MTVTRRATHATHRRDGYLPIESYAAIGDGHTVALVGTDGSIDWLCLPTFSSPSVFAALLDPARGGCCALAPDCAYEAERRYLPGSNVLETTYTTASGRVRVTDVMNLGALALLPGTEVVRRIEGLAGEVPMRWTVAPRFQYGSAAPEITRRAGQVVASHGGSALAVLSFDAGEPVVERAEVTAALVARQGERALLALVSAEGAPLLFPDRDALEDRADETIALWRSWLDGLRYDGPWRAAVERSLLTMALLVYRPSGAMVAAPTTSLPERIGGTRNYDYRYAWVRDTTFALNAVLRLGMREQAHRSFTWLLEAVSHTHPRLQPIYRLSGRPPVGQRRLDLRGYRDSSPVNLGNDASRQAQLGNYADLLETAWLYLRDGAALDSATGLRLAQVADVVCDVWMVADSGIWELSDRRHYTLSKMGCWVALDRALKLADAGEIPAAHAGRWRRTAGRIRTFVDERCWSGERRSFMRDAASDELDAGTLLAARMQFAAASGDRMASTIDTIRHQLGAGGPLLHRYSGMAGEEGAFVACSFWMAEALARGGRPDDAAEVIEGMLGYANDVGLLAEEVDPATGELLGNFPQGISHLAFLNAAALHEEANR